VKIGVGGIEVEFLGRLRSVLLCAVDLIERRFERLTEVRPTGGSGIVLSSRRDARLFSSCSSWSIPGVFMCSRLHKE
jgi:hypothetical protein